MKILTSVLFFIVCLSGCATTSPYCDLPKATSADNETEIVIYRPDAFYGALYSTPFSIDGCRVQDLSNNSFMVYRIPAGKHKVAAEEKMFASGGTGVVEGDFEAGKTYYLHYSISPGDSYNMGNGVVGFTTSTQFYIVSKDVAHKLMPFLENYLRKLSGQALIENN